MKRASTKNELCSEASDLQYASPQYFAASIKASLINCMLFLSRWNVLTLFGLNLRTAQHFSCRQVFVKEIFAVVK